MAVVIPNDATRHRHRLEIGATGRVFVKLADEPEEAEELRHEAAILALLRRTCPQTAPLTPLCMGWMEDRGALLLEVLPGENLAQCTANTAALDATTAAALGGVVGGLHEEGRAASAESPGAARSAHAGVHRPTPQDLRHLTAGGTDLIALLQRSRPLCEHLDRLCVPWDGEVTLIHGDLRPENVILTDGSDPPRLVDWEFAGRGEALWDVACLMAAWLGAWLSSVPQIPGVPPAQLLDQAALPLAGLQPGTSAFWAAYVEARALNATEADLALQRCLDLAGVRLVQLAVVAADAEDLRAVPVLHLQVAANILDHAEAAAGELLGIPWRHA